MNEWLFIKTADNEEGFVPYLCCRPVLRRISSKTSTKIDNAYKLYDFNLSDYPSRKSYPNHLPTLTPPARKKVSVLTPVNSQSYLPSNASSSQKKRSDVTSSSCGGDSGVSDCESSSHHPQCVDIAIQRSHRLSHLRSSRSSSSSTSKQNTGLLVQDLPSKGPLLQNHSTTISRTDEFHPIKSQLPISSNSAFTQIAKKNPRPQR